MLKRKIELYLLFILNKVLLIIIILNYYFLFLKKKNQLYFYNIHNFVTYTKKNTFYKKI